MSALPRILILGAHGQLGRALKERFADAGEIVAFGRESVDLANPEQLRATVRQSAPRVILNAAAYTAVDRAESEPELAQAVNAQAPAVLAGEANRAGALLVHYSTDYVFDGSKTGPWSETDATNPINVYGASKLAGERAIQEAGGQSLIFRTSWVYGPTGNNFLRTMLRLGRERDRLSIVDDQVGAPTTTRELAAATRSILDGVLAGNFGQPEEWAGLYHMTCADSVSWFGFAQAIFARVAGLAGARQPQLTPIPSSAYPTPARRPLNSVLSNRKLYERFGVRLASWEMALDEVMRELAAAGELG